jgi:hypothetical protein
MTILLFVSATVIVVTATAGLVMLLRDRLEAILVEITGSSPRAAYWTVTSLVAISLVAVLTGTMTSTYPGDGSSSTDLFFGVMGQVRYGLLGLLGSLLVVAFILMRMISRFERYRYWAAQATPATAAAATPASSPVVAGAPAGPRCPTCQAPIKAGDIWCNRCGSPVPDKPGS